MSIHLDFVNNVMQSTDKTIQTKPLTKGELAR